MGAAQGPGPDEGITVGRQGHEPKAGGTRADLGEWRVEILAPTEVALGDREGGTEDDVSGPLDRVRERLIVVGTEEARLDEEKVEADRGGAALAHEAPPAAGESPRGRA